MKVSNKKNKKLIVHLNAQSFFFTNMSNGNSFIEFIIKES